MMVCIPVALGYEFISDRRISVIGLVIGIVLAMPLALLEESTFDKRMRRLPFFRRIVGEDLHLHRIPDRRVLVGRPRLRFVGGSIDVGVLGVFF